MSDGLQHLIPADTEQEGIDAFANAYADYMYESTVGGIPVTGSFAAAVAAMKAAMVGVNDNGPSGLQAGLIAFWGALSGIAATVWITVPPLVSVTPPPTIASVAGSIAAVGTANIASGLSLEASCDAMAGVIHAASQGGLAVDSIPLSLPIL